MVKQYFSTFEIYLKEGNLGKIKKFIDSYVERVDVYRDKVKVTFKVAFSFGSNSNDKVDYTFSKDVSRTKLKSA